MLFRSLQVLVADFFFAFDKLGPRLGTLADFFQFALEVRMEVDRAAVQFLKNGIAEIGITFTRSDLEALFGRIGRTEMVTAELRGSILDGRTFCAGVALNVKNVGPPHAVVFAPNPLNPRSKLTFATTRPGSARAQLFDLQGRLVRTLLDVAVLEAGTHEVFFDGKSSRGQPVSSGVLFYRLTSTEGTFEGRIVVLK